MLPLALSKLLFAFTGASIVFACSPQTASEGTHQSSSSIIKGTEAASTADDSVVLLWMTNEFCTGTLIAPNLILTARHCVSEENTQSECGAFGPDKSPSDIGIALGVHPSSQAIVARGTKLFTETQSTICGQDIALVLLDKDVPGVTPKKARLTPPVVGELVTAMGYGQDENQQINGRMQRSGIAIEAVGPATKNLDNVTVSVPANDFMTGESVCNGDSGGPIFDAQGLIMGTTSRGTSAGCVGAPAVFSSTGAHAAIIKSALTAAGHPPDVIMPIPDAGVLMDGGVPSGPTNTTDPNSPDPSGPTPGPTKDDTGGGSSDDDGSDSDNANSDGKKKSSSSSSGDGDDDDAPAHKPAAVSTGCAASATSRTSESSPSNVGFLIALGAVIAVSRRRRH